MSTALNCKMCGGDIEVSQDMTVGTCKYCGSTMTLPRIDTDKKARLFNRANQYRMNCEFDKAYDAYKSITEEDEQEAEAYWGMILSEYGVEYVEDPKTQKRIPTCHRTLVASIKSSTNFKMTCEYADTESRFIYQDEADEIDKIQKRILSVSNKENPYDVFICYKETDIATGERTVDSVMAQDIYTELTNQGLRVFFSRITLADVLGTDYEPYIFSALNSAKVMLLIASSNENINAVWVKNEWSRFIRFMEDDKSKLLIPVYKDMDINEFPDELSKYQGQDFNKVGALQDLAYNVKKLASRDEKAKKDTAIEELLVEQEKRKKRNAAIKKVLMVAAVGVALVLVATVGKNHYEKTIRPSIDYKNAQKLVENGEYDKAIEEFEKLGDYKECKEKVANAKVKKAYGFLENNAFDEAFALFEEASMYQDVRKDIVEAKIKQIQFTSNSNSAGCRKNATSLAESLYLELNAYQDNPYLQERAEDIKNIYSKTLFDYQSNERKYVITDKQREILSDEYNYELAKKFERDCNEAIASKFYLSCINYKDSLDCFKELKYKSISERLEYEYSYKALLEMENLATGNEYYKGLSLTEEQKKYEKARVAAEEYEEKLYDEAYLSYIEHRYADALGILEEISNETYTLGAKSKELSELINQKVLEDKSKYNGIWVNYDIYDSTYDGENRTFYKFDNGRVYTVNSKEYKDNMVWHVSDLQFDANNGCYFSASWDVRGPYGIVVAGSKIIYKKIKGEMCEEELDSFGGTFAYFMKPL